MNNPKDIIQEEFNLSEERTERLYKELCKTRCNPYIRDKRDDFIYETGKLKGLRLALHILSYCEKNNQSPEKQNYLKNRNNKIY